MKYRKYFIWLLFTVLVTSGFGQRLRYKDLFPVIQKSDDEVAIMTLKAFLMEEPEHPNANFLLGKYYLKKFRGSDKLTQFPLAIAAAEQSQLRWITSALLIDEREIRRNNEYYLNSGGEEMEFPEVKALIDSAHQETELFLDNGPAIYKSFINAIRHYDRSVKIYAQIAEQFKSQDELILLYDASIESRLDSLSLHFDSTMYYLNRYFQLESEYDMGYQQRYFLQPLSVFKLQGLVSSVNFLADEIKIWNYKSWVDQIKDIHKNELQVIRQKLIENDILISSELQKDNPKTSLLDKESVFRMSKFDFGSLPMVLLQYKDYLLDLRKSTNNAVYYDTASNILPHSRFVVFSELMNKTMKADTLLTKVEAKMEKSDVEKHREFIENRYGGEEGLKNFLIQENERLEYNFESYVRSLQKALVDNMTDQVPDSGMVVLYRGSKYPAFESHFSWENMEINTPITLIRKETADGAIFYAGLRKISSSNSIAYVIRSTNGRIEWINEYEIPLDSLENETINIPGAVAVSREGVTLVIYSKDNRNGQAINTFIALNNSGDQKLYRSFSEINMFPRELLYEESNNRYLMIFNGQLNEEVRTNSSILAMDQSGYIQWTKPIEMEGNYIKLVTLNSGYVYLANATRYNEKSLEHPSVLALKIDGNGNGIKDLVVESGEDFEVSQVTKTLQNINILGDVHSDSIEETRHLILDPFLNIIYFNQ